ncbi:DEAD/DEAH box helicase [Cohnella candidum]|uniref:Helicase SNF n=1 Tax=Cohnella candidum TaxID=2674991 RepID=A0A3G3JUI2_9BACL|nr:DEAD/DEAH box helicase [Cohnella candidum]AYQ71169.1 helicase SNF [Cohnella candidum]
MSLQLTTRTIQSLCGQLSYNKGEAFHRARKVELTRYNSIGGICEATVRGQNESFHVTVRADAHGGIRAECTCPTLGSYDRYCQHVAAVLLSLRDIGRETGTAPVPDSGGQAPANEYGLTESLLGLFGSNPKPVASTRLVQDSRPLLDVEFTLRVVPYGYRKQMFGVELKTGPQRLYVVQKIREFLGHVDRGETYAFTPRFVYEPSRHGFRPEDDAILRQLIRITRQEKMYADAASDPLAALAHRTNEDRLLPVPPVFWEALLPLLIQAPTVRLELGGTVSEEFRLSGDPLPLEFAIGPAGRGGYRLDVNGLEGLTVMEEYGIVVHSGKLLKLKPDACGRLSELQRMLDTSGTRSVPVSSGQIGPFMEKVVPGLMTLGNVRIEQAVADRLTRIPLKAKIYLDRVKDRLLAGLEFQYGDILINPLETNTRKPGGGRILLRDGERERKILELLDGCPFTKTESGYVMTDEDAEYDFLHHVIPELEKLADIYATSAVKTRLFVPNAPPRLVLEAGEKTDWLDCKFELEGFAPAEIRGLISALEEKRRFYRLANGALMPLESGAFREMVRFLNETGIRSENVMGAEARVPLVRALHLLDSSGKREGIKLGKNFRRLLEDMRNPDNLEFPVPDSLDAVLRDYQKTGYQWLKTLAHYRFGGILADDMGLGKTLQSIAFLVSELPAIRDGGRPALIVSPASLLYNWQNELRKFAPDIRAVVADGSKTERTGLLKGTIEADAIITSYPLLLKDAELYAAREFHVLFLDEAQAFKNPDTLTAKAVKTIRAQHKFALTGTPVENRLEELWSIYDAVFPGLFPERKDFAELPRETVAKRIRPFLLRRLKTDVLTELPEKIETLQPSELLPEQKKLYLSYLAKLRKESLKHLAKDDFRKNRIKILAGLTRLRQLCCHPALFVEGYAGSSSKFEQLLEIVEECRGSGRRMLVFSQFTEMLGLIRRELSRQGVPYFYLDGQTPPAERIELCNSFNDGEKDVFLISLKAGGTGLNLTGADTVVLYDLWWNPAVEQQAEDRAHRFGQKSVVQVIRLVAQGTVEEKMYALQQRKKNLIEEVIQPGQEALSSLTEQDIREILMLE